MNPTDMNSVFVRQSEPKQVVRYDHPYGGVATQIAMTKEQFGRFFGVSEMVLNDLPCNMKVYDQLDGDIEWLGYKVHISDKPIVWLVTAVNYKREPEYAV